jgi:hypothetical protein
LRSIGCDARVPPGQRKRLPESSLTAVLMRAGVITPRYYWSPVGNQTPRDGSYRMAQASGATRQVG